MLAHFVEELVESIENKTHVTSDILDDLQRVLRGEPQIHDPQDPDDPEGKYAFVLTRKSEIRLLEKAVASAAAARPRYQEMLFEMAFMYLVSIFDAFIQDLFIAAFEARPEALRSRKQITYETALTLRTHAALVNYLAEKEMLEVGHRPFMEQLDFFRQKFGVDLAGAGVYTGHLNEMFARRNLLAHNNGLVNAIYRERVPRSRVASGKRLTVRQAYWRRARRALDSVAVYMAERVKRKLTKRGPTALTS